MMISLVGIGLLAVLPGSGSAQECAPDNAGITVPEGFCVQIAAEGLGRARHFDVAPNGDIWLAAPAGRGDGPVGIVALRDTDGDGVFDRRQVVLEEPTAFYVRLLDGPDGAWVYYGTLNEIIRYRRAPGALAITGAPDTIVRNLPGIRQHGIKTFTIAPDGRLFVNIGAPSNSCQQDDRAQGSPGMDPCPLLDSTAGIWVWDAHRTGQGREAGRRFATGMRNTVALTVRPGTGRLYAAIHGRDMLGASWGFSDSANAETPAEEFVAVDRGDDFGWPYCYYDPAVDRKVLAPEYGGDGETVGRCATAEDQLIDFPAHWAPNGITFYAGDAFPAPWRNGAFLAFHGSWNRAPLPQQGFKVVFVPFDGDTPGAWRIFADGFQAQDARPVDVAPATDGSLLVSDDRGGRLYRIRARD